MTLALRYVTHSEIGLVRKNNQDSGFASPHLLVVADGMGGAAAGDLASAVAIDTIRRIDAPADGEQMLEVLAGAIHKANDRIADLVEADLNLDGMGTTVTGALFDGSALGLAHIGDSRAYLRRGGRLERLTHDHSWVQSLVDEGKISEAEATIHPHRSLLLKVLNGQPANDPDLTVVQLEPGDRLMFCSDGLCGLVDDPEIGVALALETLDEAMDELVAEALAEGGIDNITVIVADVVETAGTDDAVVLGAAAERDIPAADTRPRADTVESGDTPLSEAPASTEPVTADEERYTPQAPHRRRLGRPLLLALVVLLILGAGLGTAYAWTRTQYYVGSSAGQVAIYRGLSDGIPGLPLAKLYEVQELTVTALPPYYQEQVGRNIDVSSLAAARETVAMLNDAAQRCAGRPPSTSPTPSSAPSPSPTSTASSAVEPNC